MKGIINFKTILNCNFFIFLVSISFYFINIFHRFQILQINYFNNFNCSMRRMLNFNLHFMINSSCFLLIILIIIFIINFLFNFIDHLIINCYYYYYFVVFVNLDLILPPFHKNFKYFN